MINLFTGKNVNYKEIDRAMKEEVRAMINSYPKDYWKPMSEIMLREYKIKSEYDTNEASANTHYWGNK